MTDIDRWLRDRAESYRKDARSFRQMRGANQANEAWAQVYDIVADELHKLRKEIRE